MSTTVKRMSIALTEEDLKTLESLSEKFKETPSSVIKRALIILHYITFCHKKEKP